MTTNDALAYLLKEGYVEMKPTQAGREFMKVCLSLYRQRAEKMSNGAKERRRMRQVALKGTFNLVMIELLDSLVVIHGRYKNVSVGIASADNYVKLQKGEVASYIGSGRLYRKIIADVVDALMSPKGRLQMIKAGANRVKWIFDRHTELLKKS